MSIKLKSRTQSPEGMGSKVEVRRTKRKGEITKRWMIEKCLFNEFSRCWEWQFNRDKDGYGRATEFNEHLRMHIKSYQMFKGEIPDGLQVLHHCDNPPCCNPDHLFLGTSQDNADDMLAKGRAICPNRKLSASDVLSIRKDPRILREVAINFGVCRQTISNVKLGKSYKNVT